MNKFGLRPFQLPTPEPTTVTAMQELIDMWITKDDDSFGRPQLNYLLKRMLYITSTGSVGVGVTRYRTGSFLCTGESGITGTKTNGLLTINAVNKLLTSFKIVGGADDLDGGEFTITINGGNGINNTTINFGGNASLHYPALVIVNRNIVVESDPFLQVPDTYDDSITIMPLPWTTNDQVSVLITGLSGNFSIYGTL